MLVGRPGLSPVMVGREAEIARLAALREGGPSPAIVLIGGEAGVGKTRLVRELLAGLPEGTTTFAGQADPGSLGRPFELLLDAIDVHRSASSDERLTLLTERDRPTEERVRIGLDIVCDLTSRGPSVVVFDDLHWADSESVQLFERLAEPDSGPRLLVGTYRPDSLHRRHPAAELVPRLERRHAVTHLHLERLSPADVGAFLAAVYGHEPSFRVIEAIHGRTGGNPFFLEELLAAAGEADPEQLTSQPLPWSLGELVRAQTEDLGHQERCVLETAAVLGRRVGFDILATVSGFSEGELIPILRTLVARGLLIEAEADVFSFRHALAREAIENDLLGRERRRLHQQALDVLRAAHSDDFAAIARHAQGAGRYDEMVEAARAGARRYLSSGSTYQAIQLAELGLTEACDDNELLKVASRAAWLAGLLPDALVHAERRLDVARRCHDLAGASAALRLATRLYFDLGDAKETDASTATLAALVDQLDDGAEKGKALASLAQMQMLKDDLEGTVRWADAAIELADRLELPEIRVRAEMEKGSAYIGNPDHVEEGAALLRRSVDEAEDQRQWVLVARGINNLVRSDYYRAPAAEARSLLVRMREATEHAGFDLFAGSYWDGLADLAEWEGDLGAALANVEEALRGRHQALLASHKVFWYRAHAAGIHLEAGEVDKAEAILHSVPPDVGCRAQWWTGLDLHIAARRRDAGGVSKAAAALQAVVAERAGVDPQLVHDVTRAMLLGGIAVEEVAAFVEELPPMLGTVGEEHPYARLVRAQLLEARGESSAALEVYDDTIASDTGQLRPAARATAHVGAARALVALGRLEQARAHAASAAALLERWGGSRVEELNALERRLGGGAEPDGPAELTPREREVAALLAEGLSNGELATRLFISPKTASVHVSNILAKLGMTSRAEIAAYAVRSGLGDG
ncbi:MAG: helix-turn-helix transcriptional regulator [Acidimicrobiales bacterium]